MQPSAPNPTHRKTSLEELRCSLSCLASLTRLPIEKPQADVIWIWYLHFHTNIPVGLEDQKYQWSVTKCQPKNA